MKYFLLVFKQILINKIINDNFDGCKCTEKLLIMTRIGLISDTHGYVHPRLYDFFKDCEQIWHAGDIGSVDVAEELSAFKPFVAVYGNIDGHILRKTYPETAYFICEKVRVIITHIGGYPGKYMPLARQAIIQHPPDLFITGHSHILKVMYDKKYKLLHINPGAAGKYGFHKVITLIRFVIDGSDIRDLEIMEIEKSTPVIAD